jgi:hypothetical protein
MSLFKCLAGKLEALQHNVKAYYLVDNPVCRRMIRIIVLWRNKVRSATKIFAARSILALFVKGTTAIWCNVFRPTAAAAVGGSEKYFSAKIGVPQRYTKGVKRAQLFKRLCSISNSGIYVERILTFEFSVNISASNFT